MFKCVVCENSTHVKVKPRFKHLFVLKQHYNKYHKGYCYICGKHFGNLAHHCYNQVVYNHDERHLPLWYLSVNFAYKREIKNPTIRRWLLKKVKDIDLYRDFVVEDFDI
jgi:hypothetical protein